MLGSPGILVPTARLDGELGPMADAASSLVGTLALIPGLLVRHEYRESMLPRVLVTIGAICIAGAVPRSRSRPRSRSSQLFKRLIEAPGDGKVVVDPHARCTIVLVVLCAARVDAWPGERRRARCFAWP